MGLAFVRKKSNSTNLIYFKTVSLFLLLRYPKLKVSVTEELAVR